MVKKNTKLTPAIIRKQFPEFCYNSYKWSFVGSDFKIVFNFSAQKYKFKPVVKIKNVPASAKKIRKSILDNLVFNLGIIESFSYWKAFASPILNIKCGELDNKQIAWWEELLYRGLGQYFFENKINFKKHNFFKIIVSQRKAKPELYQVSTQNILLPISGGKDSFASLYLLSKYKKNIACFMLNPIPAALKGLQVLGVKNNIIAERKIDSQLLELNQQGFLNGHTPFVAYLSFLSVLAAVLFNKKYIILSNEKSSNDGNLKYLGEEINHQYSKTLDFENKFREYLKKYLSSNIEYFSLLRPLYELQIANIFANLKEILPIFLSCNEAEKTYSGTKTKLGRWCGACPKCLFVYMVLYPFAPTQTLKNIFNNEDLFNKPELLPILFQLIGEKEVKPWECVGTKDEANIAMYLSWKKNVIRDIEQPYLLEFFAENFINKNKNWEKEAQKLMNNWDTKNNIPKKFNYRRQIKF
ncbi:MAG TPA: hypothetical protein P5083_00340 [Candidatus Paceibacterota bacterium]|nr:hypothetical protein [Candidatus Pacearchaeota archaeon]HRR94578.1 hypothetical protein [Candidatus Paceibacterota bacterium]HRU20662.1 hypothetical protein [Candidatus Paceibacterota bacterium]